MQIRRKSTEDMHARWGALSGNSYHNFSAANVKASSIGMHTCHFVQLALCVRRTYRHSVPAKVSMEHSKRQPSHADIQLAHRGCAQRAAPTTSNDIVDD